MDTKEIERIRQHFKISPGFKQFMAKAKPIILKLVKLFTDFESLAHDSVYHFIRLDLTSDLYLDLKTILILDQFPEHLNLTRQQRVLDWTLIALVTARLSEFKIKFADSLLAQLVKLYNKIPKRSGSGSVPTFPGQVFNDYCEHVLKLDYTGHPSSWHVVCPKYSIVANDPTLFPGIRHWASIGKETKREYMTLLVQNQFTGDILQALYNARPSVQLFSWFSRLFLMFCNQHLLSVHDMMVIFKYLIRLYP